jgi:hypothetical protein
MSNDIQFYAKKGSRLAGLKRTLLRGPRKAKRRVSLRVPPGVMGSVRRLAIRLDIPVTELCQMLIGFASMLYFLRLEKQERVDAFLSDVRLSGGLKALGGHEPRVVPALGEPVSLRFPTRFLETASLYARLTGRSRSDLLLQFLEQGIRIYARSWIAVTKALTTAVKGPSSRATRTAPQSRG